MCCATLDLYVILIDRHNKQYYLCFLREPDIPVLWSTYSYLKILPKDRSD